MKHFRKAMPAIALVLLSGSLSVHAPEAAPSLDGIRPEVAPDHGTEPANAVCRIRILVEQPGYLYTVPQIREMVQAADIVVRAIAADSLPQARYDSIPQSEITTVDLSEIIVTGGSEIRFRPIEVLRGPFPATEFTYHGIVADGDDFNTLPVPYRMVRSAGQRGDCYAKDYRLGAEYLFLLQRRDDALTPHWFPLGPTNEQIRGDDDPWLQWVREQLAEDPGPEGLPPLR